MIQKITGSFCSVEVTVLRRINCQFSFELVNILFAYQLKCALFLHEKWWETTLFYPPNPLAATQISPLANYCSTIRSSFGHFVRKFSPGKDLALFYKADTQKVNDLLPSSNSRSQVPPICQLTCRLMQPSARHTRKNNKSSFCLRAKLLLASRKL